MTDCSGVPPRNACGVVLGEPAVYVGLGLARFSLTITMRGNICPATCVASPRELSAAEGEAAHRRVSDGCKEDCEEGCQEGHQDGEEAIVRQGAEDGEEGDEEGPREASGGEEGAEASGGEEARPREACHRHQACRGEALHQGRGEALPGEDEGVTTGQQQACSCCAASG